MILNSLRNDTPKWQDLVIGKSKHLNCASLGAKSSCAGQQNATTLPSLRDWTTWAKSNRADCLDGNTFYLFRFFLFASFLLPNLLSSLFLVCLLSSSWPALFFACFTLLACYIPFFILFSFFISMIFLSFFLSFSFSLFLPFFNVSLS